MKPYKLLLLFFCMQLLHVFSFGQSDSLYLLNIQVKEEISLQAVAGATVFILPNSIAMASDSLGAITCKLKSGKYTFNYSAIGFDNLEKSLILRCDTQITVLIKSNIILVNTVNVYAKKRDSNVDATQMGVSEININNSKNLPLFMGELDPVKLIQFSSGVQTTGDGNTGLYVRGGSPGQNLVLYDGTPIYNPAHLMGIFSVFNGDAIEQVRLTKSAIPAMFGGRSS